MKKVELLNVSQDGKKSKSITKKVESLNVSQD